MRGSHVIRFGAGVPPGKKVVAIRIPGCRLSLKPFYCKLFHELSNVVDGGVCKDAIWKLTCDGLPDRYVHLLNGKQSLEDLLRKYSFFDLRGCVFNMDTKNITMRNIEAHSPLSWQEKNATSIDLREPKALLRDASVVYRETIPCHVSIKDVGIPQNTQYSGICWWGALWFALCYCPANKEMILKYVRTSQNPRRREYEHLISQVLRSKAASEELRRLMYDDLGLGDDPRQDPRLDGQNGYYQFSIFCSAFGVPLTTVIYPLLGQTVTSPLVNSKNVTLPCPPEMGRFKGFLGIRTHRTRFVPRRYLKLKGKRWKLTAALIGSEYCHHQVALASTCDLNSTWAMYDSDGVRLGVGPMSWSVPGSMTDDEWWEVIHNITPVINWGANSRFCDMNPHNRHPMEMFNKTLAAEEKRHQLQTSDESQKLVNMDWIYAEVDAGGR